MATGSREWDTWSAKTDGQDHNAIFASSILHAGYRARNITS
jgi:hypothetical protein